MKRSRAALVGVLSAGFAIVFASGCSDDSSDLAAGGSAGSAGSGAGSGGKGGGGAGGAHAGSGGGIAGEGGLPNAEAGFGGADLGGAPGQAGDGGTSGASTEAGSGGESPVPRVCEPALSKPDVPADIAVASSAVLVAAYAAVGTQTYTCQATVSGAVTTYAWSAASVPAATLYGQSCAQAATHYAGPHWRANDGSIIVGTKVRSDPSVTAASIPRLLLSAVAEGGATGILTPVTAVQRLDTVGGIAPSSGCDAANVSATVAVPYTANYYFYSGVGAVPPPSP